jgi:hypothetical protein
MKRRAFLLFAAATPLLLTGCGKKGKLRPPPGEEGRYTYPHRYPAPKSVLPQGAPPPHEQDLDREVEPEIIDQSGIE